MVNSKGFEGSVAVDKPLFVDRLANPKWPSTQLCWEAKGAVANAYVELDPRIRKELKESLKEASGDIYFSLCMVGSKPRKAKPIIIFSSTDPEARKNAREAIVNSGMLARTEFDTGHLRHLPSGPIKEVAHEDVLTSELSSFTFSGEILFDPAEPIRLVGMPIIIRSSPTSVRKATANAVQKRGKFGYITAAHAFKERVPTDDLEANDVDIDIPFDSDTDTDEEDDESDRHSDTSPDSTESERSFLTSHGTSLSRGTSQQTAQSSSSLTTSGPDSDHQQPNVPGLAMSQAVPDAQYKPLGHLQFSSAALDFALIIVTDATVIAAMEELRRGLERLETSFTTEAGDLEHKQVLAWTSRGPQLGSLVAAPMAVCRSDSKSYELMYKFRYGSADMIRMGDCGSLVTDPDSTVLYGHVVAISESVRTAYTMAHKGVEEILKRAGGWHLLTIKGDTAPQSLRVSPSTSEDAGSAKTVVEGLPLRLESSGRSPSLWNQALSQILSQRSSVKRGMNSRVDSKTLLARRDSDVLAPAPTGKPLELVSGTVSLLFQLFAACMLGYDLVADVCLSHKDFDVLARLKMEQFRLINWADLVKLDFNINQVVLDSATQATVLYLLDQQRMLLSDFRLRERDSRTRSNEALVRAKESNAIEIPAVDEEEVVQKARIWTKTSQDRPERMRWGAYNSLESALLVGKLANLNRDMLQALDADQIKEGHTKNKRTSERFLALNPKSATIAQIILSESGKSAKVLPQSFSDIVSEVSGPFSSKSHVLNRFLQSTGGSTVVGSESGETSMLPQHAVDRTTRGTKLPISDFTDRYGAPIGDVDDDDAERTEAEFAGTRVWIEWKWIELDLWPTSSNLIEERVSQLSAMLEMNNNDPYQFCLPRGLGYLNDRENGRLGLVFERPDGTAGHTLVSLHDLFSKQDKQGKSAVPPLSDRIGLMRILAETVERLHAVDWQHQGLRSSSILFFADPAEGPEDSDGIDLANPYVSGFNYSRPAQRDDLTERPLEDLAADLYRHPVVQRNRNVGFLKSHDMYALGIILLEIAYWEPADQLLAIDTMRVRQRDALGVRERLLSTDPRLLGRVRSNLGKTIESIIRACLVGPAGFHLGDEFDESAEEGEATLRRAFSEQVVARLAAIRGL